MIGAMHLTPRQTQTLRAIQTLAPTTLNRVCEAIGCTRPTTQQYLHALKLRGLICSFGKGPHARWVLVPQCPPKDRNAIEQCASVWEYARRLEVQCV